MRKSWVESCAGGERSSFAGTLWAGKGAAARLLRVFLCLVLACGFVPIVERQNTAWAYDDSWAVLHGGGAIFQEHYYLSADITISESISVPSDVETTIDLNGHTITGNGSSAVIVVEGSLTIIDSTASYDESGVYTSGVITGGGGSFGAGIAVPDGGRLYLKSGTISNNTSRNYGGGVYLEGGAASFEMEGGQIHSNNAGNGGGVCVTSGANFTMMGGEIYSNSSLFGGGVFVEEDATFYMEVVAAEEDALSIYKNSASYGGGLYVSAGCVELHSGSISENTAEDGAGIYVVKEETSLFVMGATISNNVAEGYGGGMYLDNCIVTISEGTISGNVGNLGGGIFAGREVDVSMQGGSIVQNTTLNSGGGGVYLSRTATVDSTLVVSGEVYITDNVNESGAANNVLAAGKVYVVGALAEDACIGMYTSFYSPVYAYGLNNYEITQADANCFVDDKGLYLFNATSNTVSAVTSIASATVIFDKSSFLYDGEPHIPSVTLEFVGTGVLAQGTAYTYVIQYVLGNEVTEPFVVGIYTVVCTGFGSYGGTCTREFVIEKTDLSVVAIWLSEYSYYYTGEVHKPTLFIGVYDAILVEDKDYTYVIQDAEGNEVAEPTEAGTYTVVATGINNCTGTNSVSYVIEAVEPGTVVRLGGVNRYATMALVSQEAFDDGTCDYVIVCRGDKFPDALAAAGLAGMYGAQVLLTKTASLTAQTADEITRLGAKHVIVIGDENSVSEKTYSQIANLVGGTENVERIAGADRYKTSLAIFDEIASSIGVSENVVIVTTGVRAADSLSISSVSYAIGAPIVLVNKSGMLSDEALDAFKANEVSMVVILGDTKSVSQKAEDTLIAMGVNTVRLEGSNRYETSIAIAEWTLELGFDLSGVAVTAGDNGKYADALVASALCGNFYSPVLLVKSTDKEVTAVTELLKSYNYLVGTVYVLGSSASVSEEAFKAIENAVS